MTRKQFISKYKALKAKVAKVEKAVSKELGSLGTDFIKSVSPVMKNKVYELVSGGTKRRGFNRFVVYDQRIQMFGDSPIITAGVWWLDKADVPAKWDNIVVYGMGNPAIVKLSPLQKHLPHPDADKNKVSRI